ncbi:MAG: guanylate kinase [Chthonomonadales bacterium]|nr:guanylate kinase [Chthonomonadales bacterium]
MNEDGPPYGFGVLELVQPHGGVFVVSGPSGVGKDAILDRLLGSDLRPPDLRRVVTWTTRAPRAGETDGIDYRFVSPEAFQQLEDTDGFLESVTYKGQRYGTPARAVLERDRGADLILKIDVRGGMAVKKLIPDAVLIFVAPPSPEELRRRLTERNTEDRDALEERLAIAQTEIRGASGYDYLIVNDDLNGAVELLRAIVLTCRARIRKAGS